MSTDKRTQIRKYLPWGILEVAIIFILVLVLGKIYYNPEKSRLEMAIEECLSELNNPRIAQDKKDTEIAPRCRRLEEEFQEKYPEENQ